jgi:hypothetical protein
MSLLVPIGVATKIGTIFCGPSSKVPIVQTSREGKETIIVDLPKER